MFDTVDLTLQIGEESMDHAIAGVGEIGHTYRQKNFGSSFTLYIIVNSR